MNKVMRFRLEKWFWCLQVPVIVYMAVWREPLWDALSIPYVAFLSVYALVLTLAGAEQAAEAARNTDNQDG